jgi:hypothetical protein
MVCAALAARWHSGTDAITGAAGRCDHKPANNHWQMATLTIRLVGRPEAFSIVDGRRNR